MKLVVALILLAVTVGAVRGSVMISEVELNPPGDERKSDAVEWVELYNSGPEDVDIGAWMVSTSHGERVTIKEGTSIPAYGRYEVTEKFQWLADENESVTLSLEDGSLVDQTPPLTDKDDNEYSWSRASWKNTNSTSDWNYLASSFER
jgi:hypothetical protein